MPRKIEYAKEKELVLFESLNSLASLKQEELRNIINNAIETNREQILEASRNYEFVDVELTCSGGGGGSAVGNGAESSADDEQSKEEAIGDASCESTKSSSSSNSSRTGKSYQTVKYARDYKKCTNQIQELVLTKLNNAIAQKLTESIEILKENYIGTLKRCLKNLEDANNISVNDAQSASVSEALQQVNIVLRIQ
jgi:receptor-interacting serine/threonine-protein kinase 5